MIKSVIIINDHAVQNGGQAKVAILSAIELARRGYEVTFFAGTGPVEPALLASSVAIICLDQPDLAGAERIKGAMQGIWNFRAASRLRQLLAGYDPDETIIHWHGYAKTLSPSIGPVITASAIPHVYTLHEYFLACPNGGFFDYSRNEICARKPLGIACLATNCDARGASHKVWRVARQAVTHVGGKIPERIEKLIYISETQRQALGPYLNSGSTLFSLPNPIDIEQKERVTVSQNSIFLFVGRLSPEKGGQLFAKAAREAGVRAVFVGDGPEAGAIRKINPDAEITGWQSSDQVVAWINRSRALVFPSLWYDCQPLVPLEAVARGVPPIVGKWNAASELVTNGVNGLILDSPTVELLAEAIHAMTPGVADGLGASAHSMYWAAPQSMSVHVDRLEAIYRSLQGSRTRSDG